MVRSFRRKGLNRLWRQTGDITQVVGRVFQLAEGVLFGTAPTPLSARLCSVNLRLSRYGHYT